MKTMNLFVMTLAATLLAAAPIRAEEPKKDAMGCCAKKEKDAAPKGDMEKKMKADAEAFEKLVDEMNASTGDKKIAAMAAILNKMAQKEKAMKAMCEAMMKGGAMGGMMKKDGQPEAKADTKAAALDYYTCKMHPEVHWPVPAKCPLCSMDLVPVFKKDAGGKPGAKPEAKPDVEVKKPADPHAGHH